jgi:hypothetical protein
MQAGPFSPLRTHLTLHADVPPCAVGLSRIRLNTSSSPRPLRRQSLSKKSRRKRVPSPGIPIDQQLQIARLSPLARRYRARTNPGSASFTANSQLTSIAGLLYSKGVTVSELARASGVTYRAMKRRVDKALSN